MPISIEGNRALDWAPPIFERYGHLYLVYNNAEIVRAGPENNFPPFGQIVAEAGNSADPNASNKSEDARADGASHGSRTLNFPGRSESDVWNILKQYAEQINDARIAYELPPEIGGSGANSNSFVNSALKLVGIDLSKNMPGPVSGVSNYAGKDIILSFDFTIEGTGGNDLIYGFEGNQTFAGGAGRDFLSGGEGAEALSGGDGADTLQGGAGNDALEGGREDDQLAGGSGGDRYSIGLHDGADVVNDGGGSDTDAIAFSSGSFASEISFGWFSRSGNDLVIQARDASNNLALNVRIQGFGSSSGAIERFDLLPGDGHVVTRSWDLQGVWAQLTAPNAPPRPAAPALTTPSSNSANFNGDSGSNNFTGGSGGEVFFGRGGVDAIDGRGGNDSILGGSGFDILRGDTGNDLLIDDDGANNLGADNLSGDAGNDTLVSYGAPEGHTDVADGGLGQDLVFLDLRDRSHDMELSENNGTILVEPDDSGDEGRIELTDFETVAVLFGSGDDSGHGEGEVDYFEGRGGDDQLSGEAGDDYLDGGSGNDQLDGGTGVDYLDGGPGVDRAELDFSDEGRPVEFVADAAESSSGFTFVDGTYVEDVEHFEIVTGSGNDRLWLGRGRDSVGAGSGDDLVSTRLEDKDSIDGGGGDDRLVVSYAGSERVRSSYDALSGEHRVWAGPVQYASSDHRLVAGAIEHVTIRGASASDVLRGGPGADELEGEGGNDLLEGGAGDDVLDGAAGEDRLFGGDGNDRLYDDAGPNYLRGEEGDDEVVGGSDFDDAHGNQGNDTVSGGGGDDWVVGGKDQDRLSGDAGVDLVYGNLGHDTCEGGAGEDTVRGGQGDDVLAGGTGADWLSGDRDADTVSGGSGADIFHTFGEAGLDRVLDFSRAEGDRVLLDPGTTYTVRQAGADTVIDLGGGGQMVLVGVSMSSLGVGWIFGA